MPAGPAPIVTFLSDFGAGSGYPAQMKGAVLSRLSGAQLVDLSHEVPPFDLLSGALLLEACVPRFPVHAVHCAVVDPGVGTGRRPVCVQDGQGRRLVGPDNGLFTPFLGAGSRCWLLADRLLAPPPESATFHGRDLFAPVAAWLAGGGVPERLGPPVEDPVRLAWPEPVAGPGELRGEVLAADPFGNLLTSIRGCHLPSGRLLVEAGGQRLRTVRTYGEAAPAELVALLGSSGRLELSVRQGSAAARLGAGRGFPVVVRLPDGEPFPVPPPAC